MRQQTRHIQNKRSIHVFLHTVLFILFSVCHIHAQDCDTVTINTQFTLDKDTICPGECLTISLPNNPNPDVMYTWTLPPEAEPAPNAGGKLCFVKNGVYTLTLKGTLVECEGSTSKTVVVRFVSTTTPNAFTPNGDNLNDTFFPVFFCQPVAIHFRVYNRWGDMVYETRDAAQPWDGKVNGKPAPSDTFFWILDIDQNDGTRIFSSTQMGDVTLLR